MKQSIFSKDFNSIGEMGSFSATVKVTMNAASKVIKGTHAYTHDSFEKTIPTHKVEVTIDNRVWQKAEGLSTETEVLEVLEKFTRRAIEHLQYLSSHEPELSFSDKVNQIFNQQP